MVGLSSCDPTLKFAALRRTLGWGTRQSVNAIETGKFDPSLPLAFKLARLFGTTIEGIFVEEEPPNERVS